MQEIVETLKKADNEATESPYWLIVDPAKLGLMWQDGNDTIFAALDEDNCEGIGERIPDCIIGPFFSREDAEGHLNGRHYAFSDKAYVYCHSGYWSEKYKNFCRSLIAR